MIAIPRDDAVDSWRATGFTARRTLLLDCVRTVAAQTDAWAKRACAYKHVDPHSDVAAEEFASGPALVPRELQLLARAHRDLARGRLPALPGAPRARPDGTLDVPVFPCRGLADRVLFPGVRAHVRVRPPLQRMPAVDRGVAVVLGAGNVTALPVGDALRQLFAEGRPVALKLHPLHAELAPVLARALAPLVDRGVLTITSGGADVAATLMGDPAVTHVHLTGSAATLPRVAAAARGKSLSCELGNVSPVLIVPSAYPRGALELQAAHTATMLTNNASFNCVAMQVLVTHRGWPQRRAFLAALGRALEAIPQRTAYYPGAGARFARFTGMPVAGDVLPWTVLEDVDPDIEPQRFAEECFVGACCEVALDAATAEAWLSAAVDFANDRLAGDLAATVIAPPAICSRAEFRRQVDRLAYGTVGINLWAALGYALASPPWGAFDALRNTCARPRSGIGYAHDPLLLREPVQTVVEGPFDPRPRPLWFAGRRGALGVMRALCDFYAKPGTIRLARTVLRALWT